MSGGGVVFYGVGVGPGEFELLTLKAERVLRAVDVVCYPSCKAGGSSYALRIIKPMLDLSRQRLEGLLFPMDKDFARLIPIWRESARVIVAHLKANRSVAFITEGDPMLYSTFLHVYEIIADEFPEIGVEIVPGVSSLGAAAAAGRVALGQADEAIAIVPATYGKHELKELLERFDTVVLMKVGAVLDQVLEVLDELGLRDRALLASRVGTKQEIVTRDLEAYRAKRLHYLTTLIVSKRAVPLVRALQEEAAQTKLDIGRAPRSAEEPADEDRAPGITEQDRAPDSLVKAQAGPAR
jgi:precorrin-2/cobalt-factor-2 C20-methyltransferase